MKRTIYINNQRIRLDASQLIQTGGEGMVFDMGDTAVKLYHTPTKQHQNKLTHLLNLNLPTGVLGPCHIVHNPQKQLIGFQMPKLPDGSLPFKQLASPIYWQKQAVQTQTAVMLLHTVRQTLSQLHQANIIVGDLNDTNLFFTPSSKQPQAAHRFTPSWLDVDSYQFAQFPCPVAMESFLDPQLYHVADFSRQPVFTEQTDWYAFAVLLTKSLLQVHPYGGVHHSVKTLRSRAEAKISVLDTAVTYPVRARHPETLSDDILHELHLIFERGVRRPFSPRLLTDYANGLTTCSQCGTAYPQRRPGCPACRHQSPTPQHDLSHQIRTLLQVDGMIEHVALRPDGRFWVITRTGDQYRLVLAGVGGIAGDTLLFSGTSGYRFGIFGNYLVVNPPQRPQLLILDVSGPQPQKVTMLETALFRETAVFAVTPQHLYRIAGTWLMQGSVQNGHYVEDAVATVHRNQTQFWASPYQDVIAGYHRIFAEHRFFVQANRTNVDLTPPPLFPDDVIKTVTVNFAPNKLGITLKTVNNGRFFATLCIYDLSGKLQNHIRVPENTAIDQLKYLFNLNISVNNRSLETIDTILVHHNGILLQDLQELAFLKIGLIFSG